MAAPDLAAPLDEFFERTRQIRLIISVVEAASKSPHALTTARSNVDLLHINLKTGNTVNSMSIVFLSSSYEEFVREEISLCADYLKEKYSSLKDETKYSVRNLYWLSCLEKMRSNKTILTKNKPKIPDQIIVGKVRSLVKSAHAFVGSDDASQIDRNVFSQHSNNFRPSVVDELGKRIGIQNLMDLAGGAPKIQKHLGTSNKQDSIKRIRLKLDEFYERRNEIVHSLNGSKGYGVETVLDYLDMFEATAESMKLSLATETAKW